MKLTQILYQQNTHRWFQRHWRIQGKRLVPKTYDFKVLKRNNIPIVKAADVIRNDDLLPPPNVIGNFDRPLPLDENHPLYKEQPLYTFKDHNVLVEGIDQAKVLTKTVEVKEGLPTEIESLIGKTPSHPEQHDFIERLILSSVAFDLKQTKLPHLIDPDRPWWHFPPVFGVGDKRRNRLLCNRLLQLCENIFGGDAANQRRLIVDAPFSVPFVADGLNIQFEITAEMLLVTDTSLPKLIEVPSGLILPSIYPLKPHISLEDDNFYVMKNLFPLNPSAGKQFIHTAILHFNADTEVKNIYGTPITDSQFLCRSLLKTFSIAAAQARYLYGEDVGDLPEPLVIQTIQTDSTNFHFSVFQLNTLNINSEHDIRNVWWSDPISRLYSQADFVNAIPVLEDYNPQIFEKMLAFYANGLNQA